MTSKQADQILADIANGKDIRTSSGTDDGASTKNLAKRGVSLKRDV